MQTRTIRSDELSFRTAAVVGPGRSMRDQGVDLYGPKGALPRTCDNSRSFADDGYMKGIERA